MSLETNFLIFGLIVLAVLLLSIFFWIRKNKKDKIKNYQRKMLIKELIKNYLWTKKGLKNIEVLNLKIVLNKTKTKSKVESYICLFDFPEIQKRLAVEQLAFEVEGVNNKTKDSKAKTVNSWKIINELDLDSAKIIIKLNESKKNNNKNERNILNNLKHQQNLAKIEALKTNQKTNFIDLETKENNVKNKSEKFLPKRKKPIKK